MNLHFKIIMAVIIAIFSTNFGVFAQKSANDPVVFVCPPCGCSGDTEGSASPGNCTHCGMSQIARFESSLNQQSESPVSRPERKSVAILIFDHVQIIDFTGPYEVFGQAGMRVFTVAEKEDMITTAMGMKVTPAYTFENCPKADILVVPGGGVNASLNNPKVIDWVTKMSDESELSLSVCNGAFFLGKAGLLDGKQATTFAALIPSLREATPKAEIVEDQRFVDNGKIITSAGLSSGLDGSLHVVERIYGRGRAQEIATNLEYNWDPEGDYVRAALADKYVRGIRFFLAQFDHKTLQHEGTKDRWSSIYEIQTGLSREQINQLLEVQLTKANNWEREPSSMKKANSQWRFSSENGEKWKGKIDLEEKEAEVYQFQIEVEKSSGK